MCDEDTEMDNAAHAQRVLLNRRELGLGGASAMVATLVAGCAPGAPPPKHPSASPTSVKTDSPKPDDAPPPTPSSRRVTIETPEGTAEAFFVAPSSGRHPAVIVWPDIAGLRGAFETMATRLAEAGYAVLAVNQYYRSSKLPILTTFSDWRTDEGKAKIAPMAQALSPEGIASDARAFAAWLDQQERVDADRKIATTGYCMGGRFAFFTAAAAPERVGVVASFHGGGLATDEPTSPHHLLSQTKAAALICIAQNDDDRRPQDKTTLSAAAQDAGATAEIEVYAANHGWCVIDSPVYDETQAERAWARMLATFEQHL